jgi:hypothetical protein
MGADIMRTAVRHTILLRIDTLLLKAAHSLYQTTFSGGAKDAACELPAPSSQLTAGSRKLAAV